jgi:hypothetical protein
MSDKNRKSAVDFLSNIEPINPKDFRIIKNTENFTFGVPYEPITLYEQQVRKGKALRRV